MIELTREPIDTTALLQRIQSPAAGAVLLFLGTVREFTAGRQTARLEYEAYETMARSKMAELADAAVERWNLVGCAIVHRLGTLELGEASVAVAVSSAHRAASFAAGQWLIDTLKDVVPVWKREIWSDGSTEWVHPEKCPTGAPPPSLPESRA
ncbi:MAG: molybdenum cofactor biosynthesis protein MoaE [Planctomycetaceae bacterium]|nr:molybdenum cofactor biosynthesis protein MoaE [Planctomycetaceae bacterium]